MFCYRRDGGNYLEPGVLGIILHLDEGILISTISINCSNHAFCSVSFYYRKSIQSKLRCNTTKRWHCNHYESFTLKTNLCILGIRSRQINGVNLRPVLRNCSCSSFCSTGRAKNNLIAFHAGSSFDVKNKTTSYVVL